jgi:hypothetical protein
MYDSDNIVNNNLKSWKKIQKVHLNICASIVPKSPVNRLRQIFISMKFQNQIAIWTFKTRPFTCCAFHCRIERTSKRRKKNHKNVYSRLHTQNKATTVFCLHMWYFGCLVCNFFFLFQIQRRKYQNENYSVVYFSYSLIYKFILKTFFFFLRIFLKPMPY